MRKIRSYLRILGYLGYFPGVCWNFLRNRNMANTKGINYYLWIQKTQTNPKTKSTPLIQYLYIGLSPLPVRVTTRIVTFLVGNPNLNLHFHYYWEGGQPHLYIEYISSSHYLEYQPNQQVAKVVTIMAWLNLTKRGGPTPSGWPANSQFLEVPPLVCNGGAPHDMKTTKQQTTKHIYIRTIICILRLLISIFGYSCICIHHISQSIVQSHTQLSWIATPHLHIFSYL